MVLPEKRHSVNISQNHFSFVSKLVQSNRQVIEFGWFAIKKTPSFYRQVFYLKKLPAHEDIVLEKLLSISNGVTDGTHLNCQKLIFNSITRPRRSPSFLLLSFFFRVSFFVLLFL